MSSKPPVGKASSYVISLISEDESDISMIAVASSIMEISRPAPMLNASPIARSSLIKPRIARTVSST